MPHYHNYITKGTMDSTVDVTLHYVRKEAFTINSGEDWMGARVRAMTHPIPWAELSQIAKEHKEEQTAILAKISTERARIEKKEKLVSNLPKLTKNERELLSVEEKIELGLPDGGALSMKNVINTGCVYVI